MLTACTMMAPGSADRAAPPPCFTASPRRIEPSPLCGGSGQLALGLVTLLAFDNTRIDGLSIISPVALRFDTTTGDSRDDAWHAAVRAIGLHHCIDDHAPFRENDCDQRELWLTTSSQFGSSAAMHPQRRFCYGLEVFGARLIVSFHGSWTPFWSPAPPPRSESIGSMQAPHLTSHNPSKAFLNILFLTFFFSSLSPSDLVSTHRRPPRRTSSVFPNRILIINRLCSTLYHRHLFQRRPYNNAFTSSTFARNPIHLYSASITSSTRQITVSSATHFSVQSNHFYSTSTIQQGSYVGIHSTGFRDFLLKPELLRAISDLGFEHPSEVQQECIPQSILGMDVVCQAKSGMGKTAVFVLATLQQIEPVDGEVSVLVLCHTRELAYQIRNEYARFTKYMPDVRTGVIYGGTPVAENQAMLKDKAKCPHILVGTPGRMNALVRDKSLKVSGVKHFVIDECDKILEQVDMRRDVQDIFRATPHHKQVMMFSATLAKEVRPTCKKFMQNPLEIYVDDETKLTLHGLQQHYVRLEESAKNRKLNDLLDSLEFNQVIIFVKSISRANELDKLLRECNFPSICIHGGLAQEERIKRYQQFKNFEKRILVATDIFGRGIDVERVNVSISYDTPTDADSYLHRVGRAGRFGTKGLAIMFVSSDEDAEVLKQIQSRFEVAVPELPETIEASSYMNA